MPRGNDYGFSFEVNNLLWKKDQEIISLKREIAKYQEALDYHIKKGLKRDGLI